MLPLKVRYADGTRQRQGNFRFVLMFAMEPLFFFNVPVYEVYFLHLNYVLVVEML